MDDPNKTCMRRTHELCGSTNTSASPPRRWVRRRRRDLTSLPYRSWDHLGTLLRQAASECGTFLAKVDDFVWWKGGCMRWPNKICMGEAVAYCGSTDSVPPDAHPDTQTPRGPGAQVKEQSCYTEAWRTP